MPRPRVLLADDHALLLAAFEKLDSSLLHIQATAADVEV